ncbi:MAG: Zn-ribbon domain-containing OB-fold protein [Candidatus Hadarchaeales archaeon]
MSVARFWREIPSRYNFIGSKCGNCNKIMFPPRFICPYCRRTGKIEPYNLSRFGKILSYTVVYSAAEGFEDQTPYVLAIVELDDGPRITTQVTDCDLSEVKIGDRVEMIFRRMGEDGEEGVIYYGYKARKISG